MRNSICAHSARGKASPGARGSRAPQSGEGQALSTAAQAHAAGGSLQPKYRTSRTTARTLTCRSGRGGGVVELFSLKGGVPL